MMRTMHIACDKCGNVITDGHPTLITVRRQDLIPDESKVPDQWAFEMDMHRICANDWINELRESLASEDFRQIA